MEIATTSTKSRNDRKLTMIKYLDEYRNPALAMKLLEKILAFNSKKRLNFMEVCGTHTMSISKFGLRKALSPKINLISGPGCPVCVTPMDYLDKAIGYSRQKNYIIATFGDMFRVPGSKSSLEKEKSCGADIRIIYSPLDCLKIAKEENGKRIIFLAVGFETTTPTIAGMIKEAQKADFRNLFILCGNKLIPPALEAVLHDKEVNVDGFILPAHVSTMIGYAPYKFVSEKYRIPCVITGFESLDILAGIEMLLEQIKNNRPKIGNEYTRFAKESGNLKAIALSNEIFMEEDTKWRGFGKIASSGLTLKGEYARFNIEMVEPIKVEEVKEPKGCLCGNVVKGLNIPPDCKLFGKGCTPSNPIGACMVSSEGTCAAYYKYERI